MLLDRIRALHPELGAVLASLRPLLANALAGAPGRDVVLVVILSREPRGGQVELVAQFFGALRTAAARRLAGVLAPSLAPLLRETPPVESVWCLVLGPRKALVAFPT